jgi:hypothetical protein
MKHPNSLRSQVLVFLCLATAALVPAPAFAWGREGHQLVAALAEQQLDAEARVELNRLLALEPELTLAAASTWADEHRSATTAPWHYVNFPRDSCSYDEVRDCPGGRCVVGAIERQTQVLRSWASDDERLKALKYLIHLVADVHQPLHAGYADDKGGNTFQIRAFGRGTNLHALWDSGLIDNRVKGPQGLRAELAAELKSKRSSQRLIPAEWAEESCRIVQSDGFYPGTHKMGVEYPRAQDATLRSRLLSAARRLAALLNDSLVLK